MKTIILLLIVLLPSLGYSQEKKKVVKKQDIPPYKEVYYVLKSDKKTKHGEYVKYDFNEGILIQGTYIIGEKDGLWKEFGWGGLTPKSQGNYKMGKKVGKWDFFNPKGELEQVYNFDTKELLFFNPSEAKSEENIKVIIGSDTLFTQVERLPLYIGGQTQFFEDLNASLIMPDAIKKKDSYNKTVYITAQIDTNGVLTEPQVLKEIGFGCDEAAIEAFKNLPNNWVPGIVNGQNTKMEMVFPVNFRIR